MSDWELTRLVNDEPRPSPGLADWLAEHELSLALTKGPNLFLVGTDARGEARVAATGFGQCTAVHAHGSGTLLLATRYQIWRLENALPQGTLSDDGHDRLLVPQAAWTTGALEIRDLRTGPGGEVVFVNGLLSCLARPSERLSFEPLWLPPFVSALATEDRCGLSGVALGQDGTPAYVTSASRSDEAGGWTQRPLDGGVVVACDSGEIVSEGLCLPSSPVLADGRLWLTNGGAGELGFVDLADGSYTAVARVPGHARGLALVGEHAVVGVSRPPHGGSFDDTPLASSEASARTGVWVVDLRYGAVAHTLELAGGTPEVDGLAVLHGARNPQAVPFAGDEVQEIVTMPRQSVQASV